MNKRILTIIILFSLILTACTSQISKKTSNLMEDIEANDIRPIEDSKLNDEEISRNQEITDFALKLFHENFKDENILISPLSIVSALGMITNGAKGNTLLQMEDVLNSDIGDLNDYLMAYSEYLPTSEKYQVSLANSIWFRDDDALTINQDFLQTNKDYYDASIYKAPFDESTKDDINYWVKDKTKGMIEKLLEEPPSEETVMYLINALSFDAEWKDIYEENQIYEGDFTLENGETQEVEYMSSNEFSYLANESSTGFIKPYKDNKYAFVALLPKEDMSMVNFLATINVKELMSLIENKNEEKVYADIPKFSLEYDISLNQSLKDLGILDAFDSEKADLSGLGEYINGNLFISNVIHKTKIEVDEKGTKAGAVTSIEIDTTSGPMEEPKEVILDRPFFYMILDTEHNVPLFMGSLMNVK